MLGIESMYSGRATSALSGWAISLVGVFFTWKRITKFQAIRDRLSFTYSIQCSLLWKFRTTALKFCGHLHKEHRCPRTSWVPAATQTQTPPSHIDKNISHSHKQKTDPDMRNLNSANQEIAKDSRSVHLLIQWVMCAVDSDAGTRFNLLLTSTS